MQSGNSFDMATLLVSLLAGVGYDAYVVSGYALKHITLLDQTMTNAENLKEFVPNHFIPKQEEELRGDEAVSTNKYRVKLPKQLKSAFLMKQEERLRAIQLQQEKRAKELENTAPPPPPDDELKGLRIHAWVLVLPGKREVSEPFFIETTTGKVYECESEQYLGLECVWSQTNFWVNMQICYDGLKGISFDLGDTMKWEFVLLDNTQPNSHKRNKNGDLDATEDDDEEEGVNAQSEIVDLPPSWVDRINLSQEQFESKCPTGGKTTQFRNAQTEVFAQYHRNDGMVQRVVFNECDKTFANMTVETFSNRKDKLFQRVRKDNLIHEFFHPGRSHGLKEHVLLGGATKQMEFYSCARPDGLIRRLDEPRKVIFLFEGREDLMVYKSITYEVTIGENNQQVRGQMIKMAEKFNSNSDVPEEQNYSKKTYFVKDDRIRVAFHLGPGRIIPSLREFRKPPSDQKGQHLDIVQNFVVDPNAKPMKQQHMFSQLLDLYRTEQSFLQAIKNYERELGEILQLRVTEEQELSLSISIYDTLRNDAKLPEIDQGSHENLHKLVVPDEEGQKVVEIDYLSPFLINYENQKIVTREEAVSVKDACLKSLRERLVEKANIIQGRLDETTEAFQQRQLHYSKNADSMTAEETEEYVQFCNDALFKIHILEKRLAKFNPIPFALSLMDGSSLGSDYASFLTTFESVERAMDIVVNGILVVLTPDYHQAFNTAIQKFSSVVDTIADSQHRVKEIRENLESSKETLECKRFDFLHLWVKSIQFKEMSRILDLIVELQGTQEKLDSLVQEGHYLHAVRVLMQAEKTLFGNDLASIEALQNMKEKLSKTKTYLQDTLSAELQNHLYLKNKSAMSRVGKAVYVSLNLREDLAGSPTSDMLRFAKTTLLHDDIDGDSASVEVDSYNQIQVLLEGLFHLGTLPNAIMFIKERITLDLYHVVDRVLAEIDHIYCKDESDTLNEITEAPEDHTIFHIFLTTLYQRLQAVLDGHIFALSCVSQLLGVPEFDPQYDHESKSDMSKSYQSVNSLQTGNDIQESQSSLQFELYTKRDVAVSIQNEVKALLYDYLTNADSTSTAGIPVLAIAEMLKDGKKGLKRQMKQIFHFKLSPDEDIKKAYFDACPLAGMEKAKNPKEDDQLELYGAVDRFTNVIESGHKLLITSNASNILIAYRPTLDFMFSLERKIGMRLANFKMYLEDFIFNVYLPQIQEQVLVYYHANVNGIDSFQADRYPDAPYPLIKSGLCLILEMHGICRTIQCMPAHTIELVKFVEFTVKKFFEKCGSRFRSRVLVELTLGLLAAEDVPDERSEDEQVVETSILSVLWAQNAELDALFSQNTYLDAKEIDVEVNQGLAQKETALEFKLKGERSFHRSELLLDPKKIQNLSHLIYGMQWVLDQISFVRNTSGSDSSNSYITANSAELMVGRPVR
ncbi:hypothetical protein HDU91_006037 [Kappamyces sp. JEL0680]|nr:hypothetical protein HDU91_006037 [Kappamyces sp. JEL0680]